MNPNVWATHNEMEIDLPHGLCLTSSDIENVKHLIQDYTVRALVPHVEKFITTLNETVRRNIY